MRHQVVPLLSLRGAQAERLRLLRLVALAAVGAGAMWVAVLLGPVQDYRFYIDQWRALLDGGDPWAPHLLNAYGPVFLLWAPFASVHVLLPKALFVAVWLGLAAFLLRSSENWLPVTLLLVVNPVLWIDVVLFGKFDVVVGALVVLAIVAVDDRRHTGSAVLLSIAAGLKFYPAALVPVLDDGRHRLLRRFIVFVSLLAAVAWIVWGASVLSPIRLAAVRGPDSMSLMAAVETASFLMGRPLDLSPLSLPLTGLGLGALYWLSRPREPITSSIAALLVVLIFYKVGHTQFHIPVICMLALLASRSPSRFARIRIPVWIYVTLIGVYDAVFVMTYQMLEPPWLWFRSLAGLPAFAVMAWLLVAVLRLDRNAATIRFEVSPLKQHVSAADHR